MLGQHSQSSNVPYMMPNQHPMYHNLPYQMVVPSQPSDVLARPMSHSPSPNVQQQRSQHHQQQQPQQSQQQQQSTPRSETNEDEDEDGNKLNILSQLCSAVLDHSDEDKPSEKKDSRSSPPLNGKPANTYLNAQQQSSQQVYGTPGSSPGRLDDQKSWGLPSLQNVVNDNHHPHHQQQQQQQHQQQQQQWVGGNHGANGW